MVLFRFISILSKNQKVAHLREKKKHIFERILRPQTLPQSVESSQQYLIIPEHWKMSEN